MLAFQQHKYIVAQLSRLEVHAEGGAGWPPSETCRGMFLWRFLAPGGLRALFASAWLRATSLQALGLSPHGPPPTCLSSHAQLPLFIEIRLIYSVNFCCTTKWFNYIYIYIYIYIICTHMVFHLLFHCFCFSCCIVAHSCPLLCNSMNHSRPGPSVPEILQARILEWVAMPSSLSTCIAIFLVERNAQYIFCVLSLFSRVWHFYDPMDCSPPGSSVHGILQAGILGWVAVSSSRGSSLPSDQTRISCISRRILSPWASRETLLLVYRRILSVVA